MLFHCQKAKHCFKNNFTDPLHPRREQFGFIPTHRLSSLKHLLNSSWCIQPKDSQAFQVYILSFIPLWVLYNMFYIIRHYCSLHRVRQPGTKTPFGMIVTHRFANNQSNLASQRNRHGSSKRRRRGGSESEEDSDS